jgi:outer membrane protein assembly factor BamD
MKKYRILIFVAVLSLSSCSKYQKLLKSNDFGLKYEKAVEFYEKGDYYRALQLFDQVIPLYRGKDKAEELFYYYAQSYYKQGDYVMASYYLKRYAKDYPGTDRAEEAWFVPG